MSGFFVISPINKSNSRNSNDIDIKLGSVTKFDKENTKTLNKFLSKSYGVLGIFPIYGWFGENQNPNFGRIVYTSYIFIKNWTKN